MAANLQRPAKGKWCKERNRGGGGVKALLLRAEDEVADAVII